MPAPRLVDNVFGTTSVGSTQTSRIQVRYKFTWLQCASEDWDSPRTTHWTNDRIPIKITINCSQATELWVLGSAKNCYSEPTWRASTDLPSSRGRGNTPRGWVENTFRIREGVNGKKTFSFGHCPNHLNSPPITPIRATWSSFFGSQNSRFESQFRTKNTIYTI